MQSKHDEEVGAGEATQTIMEDDKGEKIDQEKDNTKEKPQASVAELFSFATTTKVWLQILGALLSSIVSGLVMPGAWTSL